MTYDFSAEIKLLEGKIKWSVIYFPHPALEHFGTNGRVNVKVTVDGYACSSVLLPSRNGHYFVYTSDMKKTLGKKLGDTVQVMLEKCDEKREVIIPAVVLTALEDKYAYDRFLEMPDYIKRDEMNKIESAKTEETRSKRIQALIDKLTQKPK